MAARISILTGSADTRRLPARQAPRPQAAPAKPAPEALVLRQVIDMNLASMADKAAEEARLTREQLRREREERAQALAADRAQSEASLARERALREAEASQRAQTEQALQRASRGLAELEQRSQALQAETAALRTAELAALERAERAEGELKVRQPARVVVNVPQPSPVLNPDQIRFSYKFDERDLLREVTMNAEGYEEVGVVFERAPDGSVINLRAR